MKVWWFSKVDTTCMGNRGGVACIPAILRVRKIVEKRITALIKGMGSWICVRVAHGDRLDVSAC